ncbi:hypothetical protein F2Q70_00019608 [Brassica cretica]|uniref:Uncharacterized protein n=1 Tax=Brassica cretica TaxID=69181 RepID=A0A8S9GMF9_BRACR|nr:hypothetical protein F2Q70_00019608 [Brassica cretica]
MIQRQKARISRSRFLNQSVTWTPSSSRRRRQSVFSPLIIATLLFFCVIAHLLKPRVWRKPSVRRQFFLDCNEIADLCDSAELWGGLMRLFDEYGSPSTAGDISYIDYLFLGDYVDREENYMYAWGYWSFYISCGED